MKLRSSLLCFFCLLPSMYLTGPSIAPKPRVSRTQRIMAFFWLILLVLTLMYSVYFIRVQAAGSHYGHDGQYALPDKTISPGVVDSTLVADLSKKPHMIGGVEHNICAPDFRTPAFRVATKSQSIKKKVCAAYGITTGCPGPKYELDDMVPIFSGGKNVQANLWPQPILEARVKDHQVEDKLGGPRGFVCRGKITLKEAQSCILTDWVSCAAQIKRLE